MSESERSKGGPDLEIRPVRKEDHDVVVDIARRAFAGICLADQLHARYGVPHGGDAEACAEVGHAVYMAERLRENPEEIWVSVRNGQVVGYVTYAVDRKRSLGTILSNGVDPDLRGIGIGTAQVRKILDLFRNIGLEYSMVEASSSDASAAARRRMYEKVGFEPVMEIVCYFMRL